MRFNTRKAKYTVFGLFLIFVQVEALIAADKVVVIPLGLDEPAEAAGRSTSYVSGRINDGRDSGKVSGRSLVVIKTSETSDLRITYTDNFRAFTNMTNAQAICEWEILINDASCPSGELSYDLAVVPSPTNIHASSTVVGYCEGLAADTYTIEVQVSTLINSDCYTGYDGSTFMLEVEEVN